MNDEDIRCQEQDARNRFLKKFPAANYPAKLFRPENPATALAIIALIKKEGLTYVDAYASLQLAYDQLQFESNFVQTQ